MNWYEEVCIEKNLDDVKLVFGYFKLKYPKDYWEVPHWDGTLSMMVRKNTDVYKIILDKDLECAKILQRNAACNPTHKEEYHVLRSKDGNVRLFFGYDIWYDVLKFLFKDREKKYG